MAQCQLQVWCGHDENDHVQVGRNSERGTDRYKCRHCPCAYERTSALTPPEKRQAGFQFGQTLKERALDRAEELHGNDLQAARIIRDRIAFERGEVTADDVRAVFEKHRGVNAWGPWAGALFRGGEYVATGEFRPSAYATNHGAVIRVWRRKP